MTDATSEIEAACESITAFYGSVVSADLAHAAHEGMANRWSEFGTPGFPASALLLQTLIRATEIGYAAALQDVRGGEFDSDLVQWRPNLSEEA